jgi:hypothetical protein
MKTFVKYFKHIVYCLLLSVSFSCSDDFLNDNSSILYPGYGDNAIYISPESGDAEYPINCSYAGDARFSISSAPGWLNISKISDRFVNGVAYITCSASPNSEYDEPGIYNIFMILDVEGVGKYRVSVCYVNGVTLYTGYPVFECYTDEIDFGHADNERLLNIGNSGDGILTWQIENFPEWLTFSSTQGLLYPSGYSYEVKVNCDRSKLSEGMNYAIINIKTNDPENPVERISIRCRNGSTNSDNVKAISGTVTDAWFDKQSNILYISTKQPNRLLLYDTKTKTPAHEIVLPNAPNCFSMSEDKSRVAVGHDGKISYIDMSTHAVVKSVEVESIVFDIEWGEGDWCCYTPGTQVQHCNLKWINAVSNELDESMSNGSNIYGGTIVKKIPRQNYIIATSLTLSPGGIIVFNSQTREYSNYFHESIGPFWFSSDGSYLFDSYYNVYRTSALSEEDILPIAKLDLNDHGVKWIDYDPVTGSLWIISHNYFDGPDFKIRQLETNDYTLVYTFGYDDYYMTEVNGEYAEYRVEAHYVFANSSSNELLVIKNLMDQGNAWSIEHITVNN